MQTFNTQELLDNLAGQSNQLLVYVKTLAHHSSEEELQRSQPGKWSAIQVIEHLNSYYRFYLPAIEKEMNGSDSTTASLFKPGWLGNYFTHMMEPRKNGVISNKMKTPKNHRPVAGINSSIVIKEFIAHQQKLLALLAVAATKDINKIKVGVSLTKLLKLKLGDVFRFIVAHNNRHYLQIQNTLKANTEPMPSKTFSKVNIQQAIG